MNDNNTEIKGRWVSDSILVFISPLIAYLLLYLYEIGYTRYFGIPIEFISIDISKFLLILGGSWSIIIFFFFFINLLIILFHGVDNYIVREIKPLLPMAMFCMLMVFLYGRNHLSIVLPSLFIFIFMVLLTFLFPLLTQRNKSTYKEKLEAQANIEKGTTDIFSILRKKIGQRGMLFILTLIIALSFSYSSGSANAMNKQEFITISNKPELIVLCKYDDDFICGKIDKIHKCIIKEFSVVNIHDEPTNIYKVEELKDLTIRE